MLVLSRGLSERIIFPNLGITIEVLRVIGNRVRLGIQAPKSIAVLRQEVAEPLDAVESRADTTFHQLSHQQRNRLHTAQLALRLLKRQLESGLTTDSFNTLQAALSQFDAIDAEVDVHRSGDRASDALRALLVEDNRNESELLSGFLRLSGFEVDTAANGIQALAYLSQHRVPDVVLLDMHMPELDGPETIRMIRRNTELNNIKVFAVTGASEEESGVSIGSGGVNRWFRKPVNPEELVAEMRRELCLSA